MMKYKILHLSKIALFICIARLFCFFVQTELPQFDCSTVTPQSLLWLSDVEEIANVETSNEFTINESIHNDSLRSCTYVMETEEGEDFMIDFNLWCLDDLEHSTKANLESLVWKGFEFEEVSIFENAIYVKKLKEIVIKKDPFIIKVQATGFSKWEVIEIGRTIIERLPE